MVSGAPYYHQSMWHNLALLAAWGVPGIKLAFIDLVRTPYKQVLVYQGLHLNFAIACQKTPQNPCYLAVSSQIMQTLIL